MIIPVNVDIKKFYKAYVNALNPILNLKKREVEVLSTILTLCYVNRHLNEDKLFNLIFSASARKAMYMSIKMSEPSFNNHLTSLRSKRILTNDNKIVKHLLKYPDEKDNVLNITYKLKLEK